MRKITIIEKHIKRSMRTKNNLRYVRTLKDDEQ